ncbi:hypothetical protein BAE44_0005049 [Dichanthelium oligosanthes]|uniref:U-box domain-containing protein 4 n=1 Tax=Dichanthelium oligosanthes TaxID=888268 RepID=A0A1E5W939_9POAL|nr:hypothetical protein BAE44_0005049 [Dichanthelium oligosanthes]
MRWCSRGMRRLGMRRRPGRSCSSAWTATTRASGSVDALSSAATVLTSLATIDVNKCTIGAHPSVIPELVGLLRHGGPREHPEAAMALSELYKLPNNRRCAVREGVASALAAFAAVGSARAIEVLGLLVKCRERHQELCRILSIVSMLSGVTGSATPCNRAGRGHPQLDLLGEQ